MSDKLALPRDHLVCQVASKVISKLCQMSNSVINFIVEVKFKRLTKSSVISGPSAELWEIRAS